MLGNSNTLKMVQKICIFGQHLEEPNEWVYCVLMTQELCISTIFKWSCGLKCKSFSCVFLSRSNLNEILCFYHIYDP